MRSVNLRITTDGEPTTAPFRDAVATMAGIGRLASETPGVDAWFSVSTDVDGEPEHPERDALLALAERWRDLAADDQTNYDWGTADAAIRSCAHELIRTLATLGL